jgi:hypothetical protein
MQDQVENEGQEGVVAFTTGNDGGNEAEAAAAAKVAAVTATGGSAAEAEAAKAEPGDHVENGVEGDGGIKDGRSGRGGGRLLPMTVQLPEFVDDVGFALTPIDLVSGQPVGPSQLLNTAAVAALQLLSGAVANHAAIHYSARRTQHQQQLLQQQNNNNNNSQQQPSGGAAAATDNSLLGKRPAPDGEKTTGGDMASR